MKNTNIIMILTLLVSLTSFGEENNKVQSKIKDTIDKTLWKKYQNTIYSLEKSYNKNRDSKFYEKKFLEVYGVKPNKEKTPKLLPRAIIKNNVFYIPEIELQISFNHYINQNLSLKDKTFYNQCKVKTECLFNLIKFVTPPKTSSIYQIISNAYADTETTDPLEKLEINEYKIVMTLMALDENIKNLPWKSEAGFSLATDDEKRMAVAKNLKLVMKKAIEAKKSCDSSIEYNGIHKYSDSYQAINKVFELVKDNEFKEIAEDKLGENALTYTQVNPGFNNQTNNWDKILNCQNTSGLVAILEKSPKLIEEKHRVNDTVGLGGKNTLGNFPTDLDQLKALVINLENEYKNFSPSKKTNIQLQNEINSIISRLEADFYNSSFEGLGNTLKNLKMDGSSLSTRIIAQTNGVPENKKLQKRLFILSKLQESLETNSFITADAYCNALSGLKACLSQFYQKGINSVNQDRDDEIDKGDIKDLVEEDPYHKVKGGKVISND